MKLANISPLRGWQCGLVLLALIMTWPAIFNRGAVYFPDTGTYLRGADALFERLTAHQTSWTQAHRLTALSVPSKAVVPTQVEPAFDRKPVLAGRSIYYGILLYLAEFAGGLALVVIVQAICAGAVIMGLTRHFVDPRNTGAFTATFVATLALLSVTPLPFFVSFLMPDLFTGLALIGVAALAAGWSRETGLGRIGWWLLITAAMFFHTSNIAVLAVMLVCGVLVSLALRREPIRSGPLPVLAASLLVALVGEVVTSRAIEHATGAPPIRPPFVAARVIADGPGVAYLNAQCPSAGFLLCKYRDRLPLHSDSFLWSTSSTDGVFSVIPNRERYRLAAEEREFVAAVIANDPLAVVISSAKSVGQQFVAVGLSEFEYPIDQRGYFADNLPKPILRDIKNTAAWRQEMPIDRLSVFVWPMGAGGLAIGFAFLAAADMRRYAPYFLILASGWLINIAICGAVSTPHDRYNTRAIWVISLVAALMIAARVIQNRRSAARAGEINRFSAAALDVRPGERPA